MAWEYMEQLLTILYLLTLTNLIARFPHSKHSSKFYRYLRMLWKKSYDRHYTTLRELVKYDNIVSLRSMMKSIIMIFFVKYNKLFEKINKIQIDLSTITVFISVYCQLYLKIIFDYIKICIDKTSNKKQNCHKVKKLGINR